MSGHYVQLCPNPLRFEPVTKENSVLFDEANRQEFINFAEENDSHQYSQTCKIKENFAWFTSVPLELHVDIMSVYQSKSAHVIGFHWTNLNEIVFITNQGLEFYQVFPEKHSLKMIKNYSVQVNWFVFLPESAVLLLSSSGLGNVIHPYHFRAGSVMRLPKFEVDIPAASKAQKTGLLERDVTLANMNSTPGETLKVPKGAAMKFVKI